jgi:hypothetical protein
VADDDTNRRQRREPADAGGVAGPTPDEALTTSQRLAIDLLIGGKTDLETAEVLNVHRVTVTRWRLYSPPFRAALTARRAHVWAAAADHMRALIHKALAVLANDLNTSRNPSERTSVALAVLKYAAALPLAPADAPAADDPPPAGAGERAAGADRGPGPAGE